VIGVVGGIGAGKSRLGRTLAEQGATVIDADAIGHALLDQRPALEEVMRRFGPRVLDAPLAPGEAPRINRRALGALVFANRRALNDLEAILHPRMRRTFERMISRAVRGGKATAVVLDAAVLFEAGWHDMCDSVVFIDAPREQRLQRVLQERGWDAAQLDARQRSQLDLDTKRKRSDHVITNSDDERAFEAAALSFWKRFARSSGPSVRDLSSRPRSRAASPRGSHP
jgi:dephospho-CoA kinase